MRESPSLARPIRVPEPIAGLEPPRRDARVEDELAHLLRRPLRRQIVIGHGRGGRLGLLGAKRRRGQHQNHQADAERGARDASGVVRHYGSPERVFVRKDYTVICSSLFVLCSSPTRSGPWRVRSWPARPRPAGIDRAPARWRRAKCGRDTPQDSRNARRSTCGHRRFVSRSAAVRGSGRYDPISLASRSGAPIAALR